MRVSNLFKSSHHAHSFDFIPTDRKKAVRRLSNHLTPRPALSDRTASSSSASSVTSIDAASMPDSHKRFSLANLHVPRSSSPSLPIHHGPARLAIDMESPPAVLYGQPSSSTGALISGQLKVHVTEEQLTIDSFTMKLTLDVKMKKPFHAHCPECAQQTTDLKDWNFLHGPMTLSKGEHNFPFSYLLPGHLPATMQGLLNSIEYNLRASIVSKGRETVTFNRELDVKRAIPPSEFPRQSIRIFPPTNLTAHVELPSVIHPIGEFNVNFRLDGVIKRNPDNTTQTHWKLKRMTWHLDETQKVISPACSKHAIKAGANSEEKKGIAHQEVRTLNQEELKSGWKCDYGSGADGSIEMEFAFGIRGDVQPICDVKAEDGTEVSHVLVVEMIVAEEVAPIKKPNHVTPTGAARVLRMHFNTVLTERSGMGISWDEEQPPLYENVPASPPGYGKSDVYEGSPIPDHEEVEGLPQL